MSSYKKIENKWAKAITEGKEVTVDITISYDSTGLRPVSFDIEYTIDGKLFSTVIKN